MVRPYRRVIQDNSICEELLGSLLCEDTTTGRILDQPRGQGVNLKYLKQCYSNITLNEECTEYEKIIKASCYIMILFDNFLFLESNSNMVNIMHFSIVTKHK